MNAISMISEVSSSIQKFIKEQISLGIPIEVIHDAWMKNKQEIHLKKCLDMGLPISYLDKLEKTLPDICGSAFLRKKKIVCDRVLHDMRAKKEGPEFIKNGKFISYKREEIMKWLRKSHLNSTQVEPLPMLKSRTTPEKLKERHEEIIKSIKSHKKNIIQTKDVYKIFKYSSRDYLKDLKSGILKPTVYDIKGRQFSKEALIDYANKRYAGG